MMPLIFYPEPCCEPYKSAMYRYAGHLRITHGFKYREIAEILRMPTNQIGALIYRARNAGVR